jgi:hypothetical protein
MEIRKRWKAPTPKFWRKVRNSMVTIGAVSGALLAAPVALPAGILALAGYGLTIGITGSVLSQLTKEDAKDEPTSNN